MFCRHGPSLAALQHAHTPQTIGRFIVHVGTGKSPASMSPFSYSVIVGGGEALEPGIDLTQEPQEGTGSRLEQSGTSYSSSAFYSRRDTGFGSSLTSRPTTATTRTSPNKCPRQNVGPRDSGRLHIGCAPVSGSISPGTTSEGSCSSTLSQSPAGCLPTAASPTASPAEGTASQDWLATAWYWSLDPIPIDIAGPMDWTPTVTDSPRLGEFTLVGLQAYSVVLVIAGAGLLFRSVATPPVPHRIANDGDPVRRGKLSPRSWQPGITFKQFGETR